MAICARIYNREAHWQRVILPFVANYINCCGGGEIILLCGEEKHGHYVNYSHEVILFVVCAKLFRTDFFFLFFLFSSLRKGSLYVCVNSCAVNF